MTDEARDTGPESPGEQARSGEAIRVRSKPLGGVESDRLWDFIRSEAEIPRWLGEAPAGPLDRSLVTVKSTTSTPRRGSLNLDKTTGEHSVILTLRASGSDESAESTRASIRLESAADKPVRIAIEETGFDSHGQAELASARWKEAAAQLEYDVARARRRQEQPRQAVVIFHGMGNQRPGETLMGLVLGGAIPPSQRNGEAVPGYIKPDRLSESFEMREYTLDADQKAGRPHTDVYEAYWAHLVEGTTTGQVTSWAFSVLRKWRNVPRQLAVSLWVIRVLIVLALGLVISVMTGWIALPMILTSSVVVAIVAIIWGIISKLYAGVLGDVARYVQPLPENIEVRQRVREVGVDLMSRLHDDGRYDRIVILAHSLGSIVAYDVISQFWLERHRQHQAPIHARFGPLRAVERIVANAPTGHGGAPETASLVQAQQRQHEAWATIRANTQPWLITDFVTVGSPLAHAQLILSSTPAAFASACESRIYPKCPPVLEVERRSKLKRITYERGYRSADGKVRTFTLFHHAAPFAVTRWTNLFFSPYLLGLKGDPIGGRIAGPFGAWVSDIPLQTRSWVWRAHTGYWSPGTTQDNKHLDELRQALGLENAHVLREACRRIPLHLGSPSPKAKQARGESGPK